MSLLKNVRYHFMKDLGAPALMRFSRLKKKKRPTNPNTNFGPALKSTKRLKEIMARHYFLSRYAGERNLWRG